MNSLTHTHTQKVLPCWGLSRWSVHIPHCLLLPSLSKCPWDFTVVLHLFLTLPPSVVLCLPLSRAKAAGVWAALCIHYQPTELWISHTPTEKVQTTCSHHDLKFYHFPPKVLSSTCNYSSDSLSGVFMYHLSNLVKKRVRYFCFSQQHICCTRYNLIHSTSKALFLFFWRVTHLIPYLQCCTCS